MNKSSSCTQPRAETSETVSDRPYVPNAVDRASPHRARFPDLDYFRSGLEVQGNLGLRSTASPRQYAFINHIDRELSVLPGLKIEYESFDLYKWQTNNDQSLFQAGHLHLNITGANKSMPIAGAIPFSDPSSATGPLVYVPVGGNVSRYNVTGKIVIQDFTFGAIPFPLLFSILDLQSGYYRTPDTNALTNSSYARPYTYTPGADMQAAAEAGAIGFISAFNVTQSQIRSYWDPHDGLNQRIPGIYIGADEAHALKVAALTGTVATISVDAFREVAYTKEIFATLPGRSKETLVITSHTDGNTYVQDDGAIAVLAMAKYFAGLPLSARNKTLQFVFTSGHLTYSRDGNLALAKRLDADYDRSDVALVLPMEHMGTREILPADRTDGGVGQELRLTGRGEIMLWCVGPSAPVQTAVTNAVKHRGLDNVVVAPGLSVPNATQVPTFASFGGIGTSYHNQLVPTTAMISGPWSLWAPAFGAMAVDVGRLRNQTLAFADVVHSLDSVSKADIAGNYTLYRSQRAAGFPSINTQPVPEFVPGFFPVLDNEV